MIAVRNEQLPVQFIGEYLAWVSQRRRGELLAFEVECHGSFVERPLGPVIDDHLFDDAIEQLPVAFPRLLPDEVPFRVDDHQCRPAAEAELPADGAFAVVNDGVFNLVADDGFADILAVAFVVEFGVMHANHDDLVRVLLFQEFEIRQNVHAVDAAVGPEVEDDNLASQFLQGDLARGVQPFRTAFEAGSRETTGKRVLASILGCCFGGFFLSSVFGYSVRGRDHGQQSQQAGQTQQQTSTAANTNQVNR